MLSIVTTHLRNLLWFNTSHFHLLLQDEKGGVEMDIKKTRIIMDSGKEYIIEKHPDDVMRKLKPSGVVLNDFVDFDIVKINPIHISSIEVIYIKNHTERKETVQNIAAEQYMDWSR